MAKADKEEKEDKAQQELSLEENFQALEGILEQLEEEELSLEDSFALYKTGMEKLKACNDAIDRVEKKVLLLTEGGETGEFE